MESSTNNFIRVAILDDHQSIIDGYLHRLSQNPRIIIVDYACCGQDLYEMLDKHPIDVLQLDINVPTEPEQDDCYPVLAQIPHILETYPQLNILVISMYHQPTLIEEVTNMGVSGYILKDDIESIQSLPEIIEDVANGSSYLSPGAHQRLTRKFPGVKSISSRQREVLALCAAHPGDTSIELARKMGIAPSTFRNLLSRAYLHLDARTRAEAIIKARQFGIIPTSVPFRITPAGKDTPSTPNQGKKSS